jgi:hypothetical protein
MELRLAADSVQRSDSGQHRQVGSAQLGHTPRQIFRRGEWTQLALDDQSFPSRLLQSANVT